jgi:hypothetical protein
MIVTNDFGAVVMVCRVGTVEGLFFFLSLAKQKRGILKFSYYG